MDSPTGSDEEMLQQTAAEESLLSKKIKIIIVLLSLVLIILLLPFASDLGLPLLRPMGMSLLQRLWDATRFIAMTAAISIGIISTSHSSQRKGGGPDGSTYHRSLSSKRPSSPRASISTPPVKPPFSDNIGVSDSGSHRDEWSRARKASSDFDVQNKARNASNLDRLKGKQVVDDEAPDLQAARRAGSGTNSAPHNLSREEDWLYGGSESASITAMQRRQFQRILDEEDDLKVPYVRRRRNSASDAWFLAAARIDEEVEEEPGVCVYPSVGRSETSTEPQMKASLLYSGSGVENIKQAGNYWSPDRRATTSNDVWSSSTATDESYLHGEARTRRSASRLVDYDNGKARRRSSSLGRLKDDSDQGLRQILDLDSKQSGGSRLARPNSIFKSVDQSPPLIMSGQSVALHCKPDAEHRLGEISKTAGSLQQAGGHGKTVSHQIVRNKVDSKALISQVGSDQEVRNMGSPEKQQHGAKMTYLNQNYAENQPDVPINNSLVHVQQRGAGAQRLAAGSNHVLREQIDASQTAVKEYGAEAPCKQQSHAELHAQAQYAAGEGRIRGYYDQNKTMQIRARDATLQVDEYPGHLHGAKVGRGHSAVELMRGGSSALANEQQLDVVHKRVIKEYVGRDRDTSMYKRRSSASKLLLQNAKHSRSELNLQQLEQNITSGSRTPQYSKKLGESVAARDAAAIRRGKKSFSCDLGDDYTPEWLFELEPPLPPGFDTTSDQQQHESYYGNNVLNINDVISPGPDQKAKSRPDSDEQAATHISAANTSQQQLFVQSLVPWRYSAAQRSVPINISAHVHQQGRSGANPHHDHPSGPAAAAGRSPDVSALEEAATSLASSSTTCTGVPSPGEVNRRADEFITKFNTNLLRQRQESLERRRRSADCSYGAAGQNYHIN